VWLKLVKKHSALQETPDQCGINDIFTAEPATIGSIREYLTEVQSSSRSVGGNKMKPSTENELAGKVHEVKGKLKQKVGQVTNDPDLEAEGLDEKIAGKVQKKIGQVEKVVEKP